MKPLLVLMLAGDGTHAARPGDGVALCGACGRTLLTVVTSAFDFTCKRCVPLVQDALGLTSVNDPGYGGFVVVGAWLARCVTCGLVDGVIPVSAHLRATGHAGYAVVEREKP